MTEAELQDAIIGKGGLSTIFGYETAHWRPAMTKHGWRTPGSGTMVAGWPDLTLVRVRDRRLIFAELKADGAKLRPEQERVMDVLRELVGRYSLAQAVTVEVYVWRPAGLDEIARILR